MWIGQRSICLVVAQERFDAGDGNLELEFLFLFKPWQETCFCSGNDYGSLCDDFVAWIPEQDTIELIKGMLIIIKIRIF